jgi:hypothetical protein
MARAERALRENALRQYTLSGGKNGWKKFDSGAAMLYMRICLSASGAGSFDHSDAVSREIRLLSEVEGARQEMVGSAHQSGSPRCRPEIVSLVRSRVP